MLLHQHTCLLVCCDDVCAAVPAEMTEKRQFRAIKGTRDILPPDSALWNWFEQTARDVFESYNFREIRASHIRGDGPVCTFRGRRYGYRREGNVHVSGSRRVFGEPAAGGDGERGSRVHRARDAHAARQREALLHRTDVSPRAAAKGALPAVLPDWSGGAGPVGRAGD